MRKYLWLAPLILPLAGCYQPYGQPYGQSLGYGEDPGSAYSYNGGSPVYLDGGVSVPLVFLNGGWGYYDNGRRWHHAPDHVARDLNTRRYGNETHHFGNMHAEPFGEHGRQPQPPVYGSRPVYGSPAAVGNQSYYGNRSTYSQPAVAGYQPGFRAAEQARPQLQHPAFRVPEQAHSTAAVVPPHPAIQSAAPGIGGHAQHGACQLGQRC